MNAQPNILLVHGAWADGSSWSDVIAQLQARGYNVTAPQFPESSLADDVARLRQVLALLDGPTLLVGHSYGGQIMTALGEETPNVVGIVYIAGFGLDKGESIGARCKRAPDPPLAHLKIDSRGFAWIPEDDFVGHFAADIDPVKAKVMFAVQQALSASTLEDVMGVPAWKALPRGTSSRPMTRRFRPTLSAHSLRAWARRRWRSSPVTAPWCLIPPRS